MCGWVKLHRSISSCAISDKPDLLSLWIHLLVSASHTERQQPVGNQIIELKQGDLVYGRDKFSLKTGLTIAKLRSAISTLEKLNQITIKTTNKFSIISITNWSLYQQDNQQTTSTSPTDSQQTTTDKNVKKEKNEKNTNGRPFITFSSWIEVVKESGEEVLPEGSAVFEYAKDAALEIDYLRMAWVEFRARYSVDDKKYKDWRTVFLKNVRENWQKLWWHDGTRYQLTAKGQQAMAAMNNKDRREQ